MSKKILFALMLFALLGGGFLVFKRTATSPEPLVNELTNFTTATPAPTPMPFADLTIPYLRGRQYQSTLTALNQYADHAAYTSYLTSYDSDGLRINGLLTKPKGAMPQGGWPGIVFVHGYIPPTTYQTTQKYEDYVDYLARSGFVVFKIDLRGHGDSEGEPSGGYFSADYVIDTLNARAALASSSFVNPKAIGLWGHSMAGNIVMRAFAVRPETPAVVIWAGAVYTYLDLSEYGISDNSYRPLPSNSQSQRKRQQLRQIYGDPADGNPFWKLVAPTNYLEELKGAIQLDHATDDPTVSIEYSKNLTKLLDATSVPHEFYEYPSGGHNISGSSFSQAMAHTVQFFQRYLVTSR